MSRSHQPRRTYSDYTVACICAKDVELAAVRGMLDSIHRPLPVARDHNAYILGSIGEHNVVVAIMSEVGNNAAARVATQLVSDYSSIRFALLVGIGAGIPGEEHDVRLGDVVVSQPSSTHGGVIQLDLGKRLAGGRFQRTGQLNKPPHMLSATVQYLKALHRMEVSLVPEYLREMLKRYPRMESEYTRPPTDTDKLFIASYSHRAGPTCERCDRRSLVRRSPRPNDELRIHYGTIGSVNMVIKDTEFWSPLKQEDPQLLCIEMEAAGLMDSFPALVIRGIADYADSHKNDQWQAYAAAVAAAYMKELLLKIAPYKVANEAQAGDTVRAAEVVNPHLSEPTMSGIKRKRQSPAPSVAEGEDESAIDKSLRTARQKSLFDVRSRADEHTPSSRPEQMADSTSAQSNSSPTAKIDHRQRMESETGTTHNSSSAARVSFLDSFARPGGQWGSTHTSALFSSDDRGTDAPASTSSRQSFFANNTRPSGLSSGISADSRPAKGFFQQPPDDDISRRAAPLGQVKDDVCRRNEDTFDMDVISIPSTDVQSEESSGEECNGPRRLFQGFTTDNGKQKRAEIETSNVAASHETQRSCTTPLDGYVLPEATRKGILLIVSAKAPGSFNFSNSFDSELTSAFVNEVMDQCDVYVTRDQPTTLENLSKHPCPESSPCAIFVHDWQGFGASTFSSASSHTQKRINNLFVQSLCRIVRKGGTVVIGGKRAYGHFDKYFESQYGLGWKSISTSESGTTHKPNRKFCGRMFDPDVALPRQLSISSFLSGLPLLSGVNAQDMLYIPPEGSDPTQNDGQGAFVLTNFGKGHLGWFAGNEYTFEGRVVLYAMLGLRTQGLKRHSSSGESNPYNLWTVAGDKYATAKTLFRRPKRTGTNSTEASSATNIESKSKPKSKSKSRS